MYLQGGGSIRFAAGFVAGVLLREAAMRKGKKPPRWLWVPASRAADDEDGEKMLVRKLEPEDVDRGFLELLAQLWCEASKVASNGTHNVVAGSDRHVHLDTELRAASVEGDLVRDCISRAASPHRGEQRLARQWAGASRRAAGRERSSLEPPRAGGKAQAEGNDVVLTDRQGKRHAGRGHEQQRKRRAPRATRRTAHWFFGRRLSVAPE